MKLLSRLSARKGESFTELLCAVLVTSVAIALMAGMINTAASLNQSAQENDAALYKALSDAESMVPIPGSGDSITVSVTTSGGVSSDVVFDGVVFCGSADEMCAYYYEGTSG